MLKNDILTTSSMETNNHVALGFKALKRPLLKASNQQFLKLEQVVVNYGLQVGFSEPDRSEKLDE